MLGTIFTMRRFVWIVLPVLFAVPAYAFAADWQGLIDDLQMFGDTMQEDAASMKDQGDDAAVWTTKELFPAGSGAQHSSAATAPSPYVTIKVDGVPVNLTDVPVDQWFAPYIRDVAEKGIVTGYRDDNGRSTGLFGPGDSVTVEQLAKMAVISAHIDEFSCDGDIKNATAKGQWSERYVRCAEDNGWAVFSDGGVDVHKPATRAEVVVTVLQAFKARIGPRSGTLFTDITTATVYGAAVEAAANSKIVSGYADANGKATGFFGPDDPVTRAQAAKIFSLAFQVYDVD